MIISAVRNIICLLGLIFMVPILCMAAIIVIVEDGFPPFFKQQRIGLHQEIFTIYKVRTLKRNAPQVGTHELKENFQLKSGKFIRALKLDEFPQLYNVIRGDINLIGPRPGLISQTKLEDARLKNGIHKIKPGITGLAQVLGYDMSNPVLLADIDLLYMQHKSFKVNIIILMSTFFSFPKKYLAARFKISNLKNI